MRMTKMSNTITCPYCGLPVDEDDVEMPVDYCEHGDVGNTDITHVTTVRKL